MASGDINFDSNVNSIGDAVLFSNYLIYGMRVFTLDPAGQMNETDINHYGNPLTVANLVYLIRLVVGDAMPLDRVARITASVIIDNSVISVSDRMGAAYVVVEGNVVPELLVNTVDMKFAYDASQNVTRVLVVGMEKDASFTGSFLDANGPIVSIELATYDGASVRNITYPDRPHSLSQNYPNPFNAATEIRFRGWVDFDYTLTIYNVQGQIVETFKGYAQAGEVTVTWEAGDNASGAYFYRLESGHFSRTKKMVLLK